MVEVTLVVIAFIVAHGQQDQVNAVDIRIQAVSIAVYIVDIGSVELPELGIIPVECYFDRIFL